MTIIRATFGIVILCVLMGLVFSGCARQGKAGQSETVRVSAVDVDAAEPAIATGSDGTAYVVWVEHHPDGGADVKLEQFDSGKSKGSEVRINPQAGEATAWRGDPPTVAVASDGAIYVGWTARVETQAHATDLYLSVSRDRGRSFARPVKVNDDQKPGAHGMHSLAIATDGSVYMAWLDERNSPPVSADHGKTNHQHMEENRELFMADSRDGGKTFSANRRVAKEVCPCCKTSLAISSDARIYASWRQVLPGNLRHIAVASSSDQGQTFSAPVIVSDDRWMLAGCPVSGASLSVSKDGTLDVLWYAAGAAGPTGVYRSESRDDGRSFTPRQLIAEGLAQGTPVLLPDFNGSRAIWQSDQGSKAHVVAAHLDAKGIITNTSSMEGNNELPAASLVRDQILIACVRQAENNRRSVWLLRTDSN
jgi:hypothetical protein